MEDDKASNAVTAAIDLIMTYMKRVRDLFHLAALEAQLAMKTLVVIAILIFVLSSLLTAFWISLLTLLFFILTALEFSTITASLVVIAANVFAIVAIFMIINKIKENLFFHHTRNQLDGTHHEETATENQKS